jgi:hypothetical protein
MEESIRESFDRRGSAGLGRCVAHHVSTSSTDIAE